MTMSEISDGSSTPVAPTSMTFFAIKSVNGRIVAVDQMQRAEHQLECAVQPLGLFRRELAIPEQAIDRHCPARGTRIPGNLRRVSLPKINL
jgi:hypothetical protein